MEVIFLGTGSSPGVPVLDDFNPALDISNPKNWRTRCCIHVVMDGLHIQVDAGQEFRLRFLQEKINHVDFFILTHGHSDHLLGMDDLRQFCTLQGGAPLPIYSTAEGLERVRAVFPYAIANRPAAPGYPVFNLREMPQLMKTAAGTLYATLLPHGAVKTLGLVFEEASSGKRFAYYSDCKSLTPTALEWAQSAEVVVLDGNDSPFDHPSHMSIAQALAVAAQIRAPQIYLTHITYLTDHQSTCERLPKGITLAYDGLRLKL